MRNFSYFGLVFIFTLIICIIAENNGVQKYFYKVKYVDVPLDHFNFVTNKTFQLRYLVNDSYAQDNSSPILFYTGNEGDIELFAENTGFIWEQAPGLKALVIFAEHRYYGKSIPFGNVSFDDPSKAGYLTSEQALADYAQLLDEITGGKNDRAVIAIGGSYGGMLAAWFRMKYPHLVTGALAASAPILQFSDITPCNVFSRIVTSVFTTEYSHFCSSNIKKSWEVFKNFSTTDTGRSYLNTQFKFCKNITKPEEIDGFLDYLEDVYGNLAMANYPYENDFLAPLPPYPVRQFCSELPKEYNDKDLIQAMQRAVNVYSNYTGKVKCLDFQSAYAPSLGANTWEFQACSEIVMPMCSGGQNDMFRDKKWDFKTYSDNCYKKFKVRPREHEIITTYGGKDIDFASNIIFSNGLLDPWSGGGVLKTSNNDVIIIIIPEGAHHIDLRESNPKDPGSVRDARKREVRIIESWIRAFYNNIV